jgi:lycopene beta-cyclase
VIDATGSGAFLAQHGRALGAQTAYGLALRGEEAPLGLAELGDVFTLMVWSAPPTFLYSARFADGSMLVEETSLFAEPPHDIDDLRLRLARRLGSDLTSRATALERVHIAMGAELPSYTTRTVGFGAAAGYVHPVTGYSVAASMRAAPRVADAVKRALDGRVAAVERSRMVWDTVWPNDLLRTRAWHDMGLAVLRSLPREQIPSFFDAFFSLPIEQSRQYLRVDGDVRVVRAAMLGVFRRVDTRLRLRLASKPGALLRALGAR